MFKQSVDSFSHSYYAARDRFCGAATAIGWQQESYAVWEDLSIASRPATHGSEVASDQTCTQVAPLTINIAISNYLPNRPTIIVSSGLHGGEGFFGSAVQLALLESGNLAQDLNWVFLHALNPYGFAHLRRCNEDNVDLNRNFLLPGEEYQGSSPIYGKISLVLNPEHIGKIDLFVPRMLGAVAQYGLPNIWQAVAEGQYDFPQGLFFGGQAASKTQQILQAHLPQWIGDSNDILHLDFHTGLGKWGTYKLLMDMVVTPTELQELQGYFGAESILAIDGGKKKYQVRGNIGQWTRQLLQSCNYNYFCAEFGTYSFAKVLMMLRQENYVHNWLDVDHPVYLRTKEQMKEIFCPKSDRWRSLVISKSMKIVAQAEQLLQ
jgi:predicted deacylase